MNLLHRTVDTPYWLHLEDDWHFVVCAEYVSRAIAILEHDTSLAQVAFNRNYAETLEDRKLVGGRVHRHPERDFRYVVHEQSAEGPERDAFFSRFPPGSLSNTWWPHFSLRPSLMRTESIKGVGGFSQAPGHFEMEFAQRYTGAGLRTAFFDTVCSMHTGRLTTERDSGKANAYELNQAKQF